MKIMMADYGVGNLHSIRKALERSGADVEAVTDMGRLAGAECIVFPGVGAFDSAMGRLLPHREAIRGRLLSGVPALGVCIGAQILFESSEEGSSEGMGFFGGRVVRLRAERVPHIGWNSVESEDPLLEGISDRRFYFAHSYRCSPSGGGAAGWTEYEGESFPSLFRKANVYGTQFHPEKSAGSGLRLIEGFIRFAEGRL